jgi:hypothetical protein
MEAGLIDAPAPGQALLLAATGLASAKTLHAAFLSVWAAYPHSASATPRWTPEAALRCRRPARGMGGWGEPVSWELAFLRLVAESTRMALWTLERLEAEAEKARGLAAGLDKRARLPDAVDTLLRTPVLTPMALAARLKVAPHTATAVLRVPLRKGVVREVTGRGRFRAFAM